MLRLPLLTKTIIFLCVYVLKAHTLRVHNHAIGLAELNLVNLCVNKTD